MKRLIVGTALAVAMVIALNSTATAAEIDFTYTATFGATVRPVTTRFENKIPYIDQDAARKKLDTSDFQITIKGFYSADQVITGLNNQQVFANITSLTATSFGTVFGDNSGGYVLDGLTQLAISSSGEIAFLFENPPLLDHYGDYTSIFSPTEISATGRPFANSSSTLSLLSTGEYTLSSDKVVDLYARQKYCTPKMSPCFGSFNTSEEYLSGGADVINSVASDFNDGELTLFQVPAADPIGPTAPPSAVPEPGGWAMLLGGFATVGTALRRRRCAFSSATIG